MLWMTSAQAWCSISDTAAMWVHLFARGAVMKAFAVSLAM